jgi:hypothetical protein
MKNNEILPLLFSIIPEQQIESVTWYGNKKGKDVDLFVVMTEGVNYEAFCCGPLDICCVGKSWVPTMIDNLDPTVTEPLATGYVIFGQTNQYISILKNAKVTEDTPIYFLQCAEIFYEWAVNGALVGKTREALITLNFVYSYVLYAFRYWKGQNLVLFREILSTEDGLWIKKNRKIAKNNGVFLESDLHQAFVDTRSVLTDLRSVVGL